MSGSTERTAAMDSSRGDSPSAASGRGPSRLRAAAVVVVLLAAVLLLLATFLPVIQYTIPAPVPGFDEAATGWGRTGPLLPLAAIVSVLLLGQALRRDGAVWGTVIAAIGVAVVVLALARDAPRLDQMVPVGPGFDTLATSGPGFGWYAETLGAVLLILAGGVLAARTRWSSLGDVDWRERWRGWTQSER